MQYQGEFQKAHGMLFILARHLIIRGLEYVTYSPGRSGFANCLCLPCTIYTVLSLLRTDSPRKVPGVMNQVIPIPTRPHLQMVPLPGPRIYKPSQGSYRLYL